MVAVLFVVVLVVLLLVLVVVEVVAAVDIVAVECRLAELVVVVDDVIKLIGVVDFERLNFLMSGSLLLASSL